MKTTFESFLSADIYVNQEGENWTAEEERALLLMGLSRDDIKNGNFVITRSGEDIEVVKNTSKYDGMTYDVYSNIDSLIGIKHYEFGTFEKMIEYIKK